LIAAEARRAERAPHADSIDLYFQGMVWLNKGLTAEYMTKASGFFARALALDPDNVDALVGMAQVDVETAVAFLTEDRAARFARAEAGLTKALSLAPNNALAHWLMCSIQDRTKRAAQAITECQRAVTLDRNLAFAHAEIGVVKIVLGRAEEAEAHVKEALRLSPSDTNAFLWMVIAGSAKLCLGADEEAIAWLRRSNETNRNHPLAHSAAALAQLGRLGEAQAAAQAGLALHPSFTIARHRAGASSDNPIYLAQRQRIFDGMSKAGVPEG
jgi:tetratricopeptide (TPR) repeat protein